MTFKYTVHKTLALILLLVSNSIARPEEFTSTLSSETIRNIQGTFKESLSLAKKNHSDDKLSLVHLILIIGKVLAPIVGAIIEPLLVNIAKGITWAITYSLATGFAKPLGYEHFIPELENSEHGHKFPIAYSALKELPQFAFAFTNGLVTEDEQSSTQIEVFENVERKLNGLNLDNTNKKY
ncbi:uncharacterized protein LOC126904491 [Daktulosphaira vitifoliae]|uniref:uncharacterized protein LOC126904491 n=1 Tax=Daktulosphaira vitifoliae TaxID=58002 RepID=UPI0021A9A535|nr:uncharacterized protein LOC126904491 [Daktulosphaira vitifoliae]